MSRLSLVAGAAAALIVATGWNALQSAPVAPTAADKSLGVAQMAVRFNRLGEILRGTGVVSVTKTAVGIYNVIFERSIADCHFNANASNDFPDDSVPAAAIFGRYISNPKELILASYSVTSQQFTDSGISVVVFCPR
jgi:hypothetical protein